MTFQPITAFDFSALLGKSKAYIGRALRAKNAGELDEYQLWASLSLELLGKAALAHINPALVADPKETGSLLAACGIVTKQDVKSIPAHTLFDRLKHIEKTF